MFLNPTVNLSALRNSCAKIGLPFFWVDLGVCFCGQQHPKCQRSIPLLYPTILLYTSLFANPTNSLTELGVEIRSAISETMQNQTLIHISSFFFLIVTDTVTSQYIGLSFWITLCVKRWIFISCGISRRRFGIVVLISTGSRWPRRIFLTL